MIEFTEARLLRVLLPVAVRENAVAIEVGLLELLLLAGIGDFILAELPVPVRVP